VRRAREAGGQNKPGAGPTPETPGTKQAHAIKLHAYGRLECTLVGGESDGEWQFVAFEPLCHNQIVWKIAAIGL